MEHPLPSLLWQLTHTTSNATTTTAASSMLATVISADSGLGPPPGLETTLVLGLGVFLGSIVMGITGFGTAILHLCTWTVAGLLGFNAGSLKLAVIACSCGMTIAMIPVFFLARATQHAIKPLAISIPIGKAIAAPMGALVLKLLPARQLEAIVSVLMVLIIGLMNRQQLHAWGRAAARWLAAPKPQAVSIKGKGRLPSFSRQLSADQEADEDDELRLPLVDHSASEAQSSAEQAGEANGDAVSEGESDTSSCSSDEQDAVSHHQHHQQHQAPADGTIVIHSEDSGLALPADASGAAAAVDGSDEEAAASAAATLVLRHGFWGLMAIGGVTGLAAGLLTGATGIGGPPMMMMYAYLDVSKNAVRGTNAVMSLVQDQWIGYLIFGLIRWEDRYVYLTSAAAGATGCLIGHSMQKMMDQRQFKAVMTCLMLLCFVLMSASAAGWITVG